MDNLTPSQKRVLLFLQEFVNRNRFAPTAKEIALHFGIAEKNAFYYLDLLERKGFLRRKRHHPRRIEFTSLASPYRPPRRVPVLGAVPAGPPRETIEQAGEELFLDPLLTGEGEVYALRVAGDSMKEAGIRDGDYVLVHPQESAGDGDIVVAVVDGEATVKRLRRTDGGVRLEAENPAFPPLLLPAPDGEGAAASRTLRIAGKVVGLFRRM
ncbi:MAG: transcriptional repressor LexA [Thermodesulfobacteriota bacterium]